MLKIRQNLAANLASIEKNQILSPTFKASNVFFSFAIQTESPN